MSSQAKSASLGHERDKRLSGDTVDAHGEEAVRLPTRIQGCEIEHLLGRTAVSETVRIHWCDVGPAGIAQALIRDGPGVARIPRVRDGLTSGQSAPLDEWHRRAAA